MKLILLLLTTILIQEVYSQNMPGKKAFVPVDTVIYLKDTNSDISKEEIRTFLLHGRQYEKHITWYNNGQKASETLYRNRTWADSTWYYWNKDGKIISEKTFSLKQGKSGLANYCRELAYYDDGSLKAITNTVETHKPRMWTTIFEGPQITCYSNGYIKTIGTRVHDKLTGPFQEYYENGQIRSDVKYTNGQEYGKLTFWYQNGKKEAEHFQKVYFKKDRTLIVYYGTYTTWYENGKLASITHYNKKGLEDGNSLAWDKDGKLWKNITYRNGMIIQ